MQYNQTTFIYNCAKAPIYSQGFMTINMAIDHVRSENHLKYFTWLNQTLEATRRKEEPSLEEELDR